MIRVTVELLPFGREEPELLGTLLIVNDGTGGATVGNYRARTYRKAKPFPGHRLWVERTATRYAALFGYARTSRPVWDLVALALKGLKYG